MGYDYDRLYRETSDALGAPAAEVVAFFERYGGRGARVLDLGCGQGRDALMIARRGHSVTGVDLSPAGIDSMLAAARAEALAVTGEVADIVGYLPDGSFDVILLDRTLHMLDAADRLTVLARVSAQVAPGGWLLILDEPRNLRAFRDLLAGTGAGWAERTQQRGLLFLQRGA